MDATTQIPMAVPNPLRKQGEGNVSFSSFPNQEQYDDANTNIIINIDNSDTTRTTIDHAVAEEDQESEGPSKKRQRWQLRRIFHPTTTMNTNVTAITEKTMVASSLKNAMEELDRIWDVDESSSDDTYDYNYDDENTVDENSNDDDDGTNRNNNSNDSSNTNNNSNNNNDPNASSCDRVRQTAALLVKAFSQELYDPAIRALSENEELRSRTTDLTNQLESSKREVERLKRSEQRSKKSIQVSVILYCVILYWNGVVLVLVLNRIGNGNGIGIGTGNGILSEMSLYPI